MRPRYVLAPEAALDLVMIWRYVKHNAGLETAKHIEAAILEKILFLGKTFRRRALEVGFNG